MSNVAVIGYGVVGSGVVEVLETYSESIRRKAGKEVRVRRILDIRDFPEDPYRHLVTRDPEDIFSDPSIDIIVETIGGTRIALDYTKKALSQGRHVVTSNKELFARHSPELLALAREKGVRYMYEASVGGGIPIIRPLMQCLAANDIMAVTGILNGTTNYILTQMRQYGKDFKTALKEARENGYAEADAANDLDGHDACRKIAILSSIAYERYIDYQDILTEGITEVTCRDFTYARIMGHTIKLVASSSREATGNCISARVCPMLVSKKSPLYGVEDVFNAIVVTGNVVGDAMFYGRGAGKMPTASAIIADIIDVVRNPGSMVQVWRREDKGCVRDPGKSHFHYYVRMELPDRKSAARILPDMIPGAEIIRLHERQPEHELAFTTPLLDESAFKGFLWTYKEKCNANSCNFLRFLHQDTFQAAPANNNREG